MAAETEDKTLVWTCECCGRDFVSDEDPRGPDGVIWCKRCKPSY